MFDELSSLLFDMARTQKSRRQPRALSTAGYELSRVQVLRPGMMPYETLWGRTRHVPRPRPNLLVLASHQEIQDKRLAPHATETEGIIRI
jgi:hypothetical protein